MQPEPFGPYLLARKIAVGGTAEIFLARREGHDGFARHIAIKRILPHLAGETDFVRLLLDEARLAAHLHHGHIVQIHDVGEIDGQAYIAMEYLPGTDVGRILRRAQKRTRRVVVAHPDDATRAALIAALKALPRRLEVVPAADRAEIDRRHAEGPIDLAILAAPFAEAADGLISRHPELLRAIVLGDPVLRPHAAILIAPTADPADITALADGCLRAPMPLDIAIQIVRAVADGLDFAHTAVDYADQPLSIVHRDVNPSNVLVSTSGTVKLVDFGIARAATSPGGRRRGFVGTAHSMSPEQTEGGPVDARSDLFSLGTLIHELITGEHPYRADDMFSTMRAVREDTPPALDSRVPGTPPALVEITRRAGQKDPDARYASAEEMLTDIEELARRAGLNLSPKRLAGYVRVIFGEEVKQFGVTTMSLPAIRIDAEGNAVPATPAARDSIRQLPQDAHAARAGIHRASINRPAPVAVELPSLSPMPTMPPEAPALTVDEIPAIHHVDPPAEPAIERAPTGEMPPVVALGLYPPPEGRADDAAVTLADIPPRAITPLADAAAQTLFDVGEPAAAATTTVFDAVETEAWPQTATAAFDPAATAAWPADAAPTAEDAETAPTAEDAEIAPTAETPTPRRRRRRRARPAAAPPPPRRRAPRRPPRTPPPRQHRRVAARPRRRRTARARRPVTAAWPPAPPTTTTTKTAPPRSPPSPRGSSRRARPRRPPRALRPAPAVATPRPDAPPPPRPRLHRAPRVARRRPRRPASTELPPLRDPAPRRRDPAERRLEDRPSLHNLPPPPEPALPRGEGAVRAMLLIAVLALVALAGLYLWWRSSTPTDHRSHHETPALFRESA
ncbi:MAG: protein kinase [Myxococcales bacterium]|nr:protein kinase [Myxococcales bacterium]